MKRQNTLDLMMKNLKNTGFEEENKMEFEFLDNGEFMDTGYGFINNNGIEVCSDSELE